jgi:uncharacterized protein YndB with AHSA1/START domain
MRMKSRETPVVKINRFIKAPRDRVYAAWTDPEQLKEWFGPEEVKTRNLIAQARPDGKFQWDLTSAEGEEMTVSGEYRELVPDRKIVFTWQWQDDEDWADHHSIVTVELSDGDGGTDLCLTHEQIPTEKSRTGHTKGWNSLLDELEEWLSR